MNILNYLDRAAGRYPDKAALIDTVETVPYSLLKDRAERIGSELIRRFGCTNSPVAVLIDRNAASICAFLGVVESRNFYVPVDVSLPIERIRTILTQIDPAAIITVHGNMPADISVDFPVAEYDELILAEADADLLAERRSACLDVDPLYCICTSGSTGVPKGVLISHRSVLDFIPVFTETFGFTDDEIFGNQAPFDFDVSVKDIYSTLYLGATLYVIPKVCFSMPKKLVEVLDDQHVTTVIWAVSALCIAAGFNVFKHRVPHALNKILFSGEVMPIKMLNILRRYFPEAMFVNLYGPTEITCNCMYYIVDREFGDTDKLPLGRAFKNEDVAVLGEGDVPVRPGETGEICVRGTCLALGYYRDLKRTAEVFVQNPLNGAYPELIYRTGDLAELRENGEYVFAARKDFQIKHMGHRIELEEIEAHIGALDGVIRACCLFDEVRNKIVACYVGDATREDMVLKLKDKLPKYMIPNIFFKTDELPLTKNGKIDRKKLFAEYTGTAS